MSADDEARRLGDFATLLRQQRIRAGLTQAELASVAGVAVRTVREVERGRTTRPQRTTAELLAGALGLAGEQRARFVAAARGERVLVPGPRTPAPEETVSSGTRLPPPPTLIGRDTELGEVMDLLAERAAGTAPVTLVGLAGVGKSALALTVANRLTDRFPGGVAGVTIDEQGGVDETLATITFVFGAADRQELAERFPRRPALLLLDSTERAPQKVREVLSLLPPGLRVLAAGRAPLRVAGERVYPVVSLEVPPASADATLSDTAAYPAAALFMHRLARVRREALDADEVPALIGLVRRLGGLPLALELAAAHGRVLRLPEILARYGDRVLDLGSDADRTLREAVAGSYALLPLTDQRVLRRLSVFRHRWSVELAEQVLDDTGDPLPALERLVSMGLVVTSGAREHRFRLLDVVREFAAEQAARRGELTPARRAHARAITMVAARTVTALSGPGMRPAVARLDDLAADIWAGLSHAANDEPHTALRLASLLFRWWRLRGRDVAGRGWLRRLLDDPRNADADPAVRAWAQAGLALLASEQDDAEWAAAEAALAGFRQRDDVVGQIVAYEALSAVSIADGRPGGARQYTEQALAVANRAGRLRDAALAQANLTWHEVRAGDLAAARRRLATVDRIAAQAGEEGLRLRAAAGLAEVARLQGRCEEAVAIGRRTLSRLAEVGDPATRRRLLGTLGQALAVSGPAAEAEQVLAWLRAPSCRSAATEATCAVIEARLAWSRGDRVTAAEWFAAAADGFRRSRERRSVVESLVGLAACASEPERRRRVLQELDQVVHDGGFTLLAAEQELLGSYDELTGCDGGAGGPPRRQPPGAVFHPRQSPSPPGPPGFPGPPEASA